MTKGIVQDKAILWVGSNQIKRQEAPLKLKANHGTKGKVVFYILIPRVDDHWLKKPFEI